MKSELVRKKPGIKRIEIKKFISTALAVCAALGWWGAIYPQFTLLRGTYEIVCEEGETRENGEASAKLYWDILEADSSHIRFKSRLFQEWNALQEQRREVHESGSQQ